MQRHLFSPKRGKRNLPFSLSFNLGGRGEGRWLSPVGGENYSKTASCGKEKSGSHLNQQGREEGRDLSTI